jgi:uncharacterized protein DUF5946
MMQKTVMIWLPTTLAYSERARTRVDHSLRFRSGRACVRGEQIRFRLKPRVLVFVQESAIGRAVLRLTSQSTGDHLAVRAGSRQGSCAFRNSSARGGAVVGRRWGARWYQGRWAACVGLSTCRWFRTVQISTRTGSNILCRVGARTHAVLKASRPNTSDVLKRRRNGRARADCLKHGRRLRRPGTHSVAFRDPLPGKDGFERGITGWRGTHSSRDVRIIRYRRMDPCPDCGAPREGRSGCDAVFHERTARAAPNAVFAYRRRAVVDAYCLQHPAVVVSVVRIPGRARSEFNDCRADSRGAAPSIPG